MIMRECCSSLRHLETNYVLFTIGNAPRSFFWVKHATGAIVAWSLFSFLLFLPHTLQSLGRTKTGIGMLTLNEHLSMLLVNLAAFGLAIRPIRTANIRPFIIVQSHPTQTIHDLLFRARNCALKVCIFNAKHELASRFFCKKIIIEGDARRGKMHVSRWRGSHTCANRFHVQGLIS